MEPKIGKLERVPLSEVWKHEAADFTPWLQKNIDTLNELLEITLSDPEREQPAGAFSVDLVAEDGSGNTVIIENQLQKSDHDHLGKLITYLTAFGAKAAIWIVAKPRTEHVNAISWLNEASSADFYLVKLEAVRINDSLPAPLLTLIVGPSPESKEIGAKKKQSAGRQLNYVRFWEQLLARAKPRTQLFSAVAPGTVNWIGTGAGKGELRFSYVILKHGSYVELYIDKGKGFEGHNAAVFDRLLSQKNDIEAVFGGPVEWQKLEDKLACRIKAPLDTKGLTDETAWPQTQDAMIDAMVRFEKALKPHIARLK